MDGANPGGDWRMPKRTPRARSASVVALLAFACMANASGADAQTVPTVRGEPGFCFGGASGVCLVGGDWSVSGAFFEVTGSARLTFPNGLVMRLPRAVHVRVGTTAETASLTGSASLALDAGTSGPLAGVGIAGPDVTLAIGEGRDLAVREFALGATRVRAEPNWYYLHARFGGDTTMTLPELGSVPIPTPADGLSSQLLVGIDPAAPGNMLLYVGGGFTTLLTSGTVVDGSVRLSSGANVSMRVGPFITSATGAATQRFDLRPSFGEEGTLSLFGGANAASGPRADATPARPQRARARKPIPISIAGAIALDIDGDRDGRRFESFADMRFAGVDVDLAIDDVGLGRSLNVGTGRFYYDPSDCGGLGRLVARVDAVDASRLANTPLSFLDPGSAGYAFDALACGTTALVRLRAANVSVAGDDDAATPFPLSDVVLGFGFDGVSVEATLGFFGSELRLRGALDGRALRLRSSAALTLGGIPISNGAVEFVVREGRASLHLTGYVVISGRRFGIDETFHSPTTSFSVVP